MYKPNRTAELYEHHHTAGTIGGRVSRAPGWQSTVAVPCNRRDIGHRGACCWTPTQSNGIIHRPFINITRHGCIYTVHLVPGKTAVDMGLPSTLLRLQSRFGDKLLRI